MVERPLITEVTETEKGEIEFIPAGESSPCDAVDFLYTRWPYDSFEQANKNLKGLAVLILRQQEQPVAICAFTTTPKGRGRPAEFEIHSCLVASGKRQQGLGRFITQKAIEKIDCVNGTSPIAITTRSEGGHALAIQLKKITDRYIRIIDRRG